MMETKKEEFWHDQPRISKFSIEMKILKIKLSL